MGNAGELAESRAERAKALTVAERLETLPPRQRAVYDMIAAFRKERGYGPVLREIGRALGINSTNGVECHLKPLAAKGLILDRKDGNGHRLGRCIDVATDSEPCPACGQAVPCKGGRP